MQYETIILELMTRIKKLEDDVADLKLQINTVTPVGTNNHIFLSGESEADNTSAPSGYVKMTDEMIDICYKCGKKVVNGENIQDLADDIAETTGMNRNSAIMYLYAVQGMLEGTIYKRAISSKALKKYYDIIFNEYGSKGLKKALQATRLHINYRRECGHTVDSIEDICDRYENML